MKKNKAFTLIELLAVIIILSIIALIATPIIINVVEDAKESARQSSISGYADGVRYAVYSDDYIYTGKLSEVTKEWAEANVETSGDKVDCEEVRFSDSFETVLYKCRVGKSTKEYCYGGGKTYEDCENTNYKNIYDSLIGTPVVNELLKQYNENNTVGLLKDIDGSYYYKGTNEEVSNNFVWFAGHLWRVIGIDNDSSLIMITQQPITAISLASDAWIDEQAYKDSYINTWLNEIFLGSMDTSDRAKLLDNVYNVGIYNNVSEITTTQKVGLLDATQYAKAGGVDSFLDIKNYWGLSNRYSNLAMYDVVSNGLFEYPPLSSVDGIRPVVKIFNLNFIEGKGTIDDPYRLSIKTLNISNIKVGEYVSVPTSGDDCGEDKRCLFRVVSKDNDSIKVILNGLLPNASTFDLNNNVIYTSGNTIDIELTRFANTVDIKYRYAKNKTFNIGMYPWIYGIGQDYKLVQSAKYTGNVGLPVAGEMFTANDIDVANSEPNQQTFVNVNTIENPNTFGQFWIMNADTDLSVCMFDFGGGLGNNAVTENMGVRPVLFLNNNLDFISGEGTAENPFVLGE